MTQRRTAWLVLALLVALPSSAFAVPARFAVVIGNNRPEGGGGGGSGQATLRFADDDALATQRLLAEAGVESALLTTFDGETARLAGDVRPSGPATWPALVATLERFFARMHGDSELFLFYSGHGDVAHGEGYVLLEDRRLSRSMLYQLLARSPARRNHVVVDACKSYFLAFERGPGGERAAYARAFAETQVPAALANTGFVLSTSSDRDSHEWERYQAGVFSHEVRSALRGAADLDGDGRVSYGELGAFLATANQGIANRRFRPDFAIRPPANQLGADVLAWAGRAAVTLGPALGPGLGHVYVETASGERLLDGHAAAGQALALRLPSTRPLFVRSADDSRERAIDENAPLAIDALVAAAATTAHRGALHLAFEQLFATPFGPDALDRFTLRYAEGERLMIARRGIDHSRQRMRQGLAFAAVGLVAVGAALGIAAIERYAVGERSAQVDRVPINRSLGVLEPLAGATLGAGAAFSAAWLGVTVRWR